jgi:uncharacterized repeat protein (TIGR03803 family)
LTRSGKLSTFYSFCAESGCPDGSGPTGLLLGADGSFYGTTEIGGDSTCEPPRGCGAVFRVTPGGKLTTLHAFEGTDGSFPYGPPIQGSDGNLYGTAYLGGAYCPATGCGTVFKIATSGVFTTLHSFDSTDGYEPGSLVQAPDGLLYGTTFTGGSRDCDFLPGCGTAFKITTRGEFTSLYVFCSQGCEGEGEGEAYPSPLALAADGTFYGATAGDLGEPVGSGSIFQLTSGGTVSFPYMFGGESNGSNPWGLAQATDGNFYGITLYGGNLICTSYGCGTLFQFTPAGVLTVLHSFDFTDGAIPESVMLQATDGKFYGTASYGGYTKFCTEGCGTVFSLDMGLGPFVAFVQGAGHVGQIGGILGQGFTGTTSVALNGTPASFTVVSDTFIRATVPPGATTGFVTVVTASGTLTSNVPFRVIR